MLRSASIPQGMIFSSPGELPQTSKFSCQLRKKYLHPPLTPTLRIGLTYGVWCGELLFWHHTFKLADANCAIKNLQTFCAETFVRGDGTTIFSSPPQASSQVGEQTKVLPKVDSWQVKVSRLFSPRAMALTPMHGHRGARGRHVVCVSFGYAGSSTIFSEQRYS